MKENSKETEKKIVTSKCYYDMFSDYQRKLRDKYNAMF